MPEYKVDDLVILCGVWDSLNKFIKKTQEELKRTEAKILKDEDILKSVITKGNYRKLFGGKMLLEIKHNKKYDWDQYRLRDFFQINKVKPNLIPFRFHPFKIDEDILTKVRFEHKGLWDLLLDMCEVRDETKFSIRDVV